MLLGDRSWAGDRSAKVGCGSAPLGGTARVRAGRRPRAGRAVCNANAALRCLLAWHADQCLSDRQDVPCDTRSADGLGQSHSLAASLELQLSRSNAGFGRFAICRYAS